MSRQTVAFFVTVVVVLAPQISQGDQNEEARIWFSARFHESEKFITVVAAGNGSTRNAYLTVYEVLSDFKLRRLQSRFLIHKCHHTDECLCGSGRFFITTNQSGFHERTNPLVVYDLVRNEYTAYAIDELFSQDQLRQIRRTRAPFISPNDDLNDDLNDEVNDDVVEWSQSLDKCQSHFDAKQLSFTMYAEAHWTYRIGGRLRSF